MQTLIEKFQERLLQKIYIHNPQALIESVTVGDVADPLTWTVQFQTQASAEQQREITAFVQSLQTADLADDNDADQLNVTPRQVAQLLLDINARQTQITTERTAIAGDITALASATTLAQVRPIVGRMLAREDNALTAENRILQVLERLIKAVRRLV